MARPGPWRMLTTVPQPVVEVQDAFGLLRQAPAQHTHDRRDADAARDEDRRDLGISVDEEATGWCANPKQVALLHPVMQMVGGDAGWQVRLSRWRRHPLDRDAVCIRPRCVGDGVAARDRPACAAHRLRDVEREGEELAHQKWRQRRPVHRREMEGALRPQRILELAPQHAEVTQARPGQGLLARARLERQCRRRRGVAPPAPGRQADSERDLKQQRRADIEKELEGRHGPRRRDGCGAAADWRSDDAATCGVCTKPRLTAASSLLLIAGRISFVT